MTAALALTTFLAEVYSRDLGALRFMLRALPGVDVSDIPVIAPGTTARAHAQAVVRTLEEQRLLGADSPIWDALRRDFPFRSHEIDRIQQMG